MPAGSPSGGVGVGSGTDEDPPLHLGPSAQSSAVNDNGSALSVVAAAGIFRICLTSLSSRSDAVFSILILLGEKCAPGPGS